MALTWDCTEKLTALSLGVAGLAIGDPGMMAGSVIGGTGLFAAWKQAKENQGLESEDLLAKVRQTVSKDYEDWAKGRAVDEALIRRADVSMVRHLAECIPDIGTLADTAFSDSRYPERAAVLVVNRLADRDTLFSDDGPGANPVAREFALRTVESALSVALGNEAYAAQLRTQMQLRMAQELTRLREKVDAIIGQLSGVSPEVQAMMDQIPDLALRGEIMKLVGSHEAASLTEIAGDLARFGREYRQLLDQLEGFRAEDNQLKGAVQAAKEALEKGDIAKARQLYDEATVLAEDRAAAPVRELADVLDQKARTALIDRDWRAAEQAWQQAVAVLLPFDSKDARRKQRDAASALQDHGTTFGTPLALTAAIQFWVQARDAAKHDPDNSVWAMTQNNLGNGLSTQGERTGGSDGLDLLAAAVRAYEAALTVYTEQDMSQYYGIVQSNLAQAETLIAERGGSAGE